MFFPDSDKILKTLAKSGKYQTLFSFSKESNIYLFTNITDYTSLQLYFLNLLNSYYNIYMDIALQEVDSIVLTDDIYEEAYLYYKQKQRNKDFTKIKDNTPKSEKAFTWVFKQKPKSP
jgi:hypothetical protein